MKKDFLSSCFFLFAGYFLFALLSFTMILLLFFHPATLVLFLLANLVLIWQNRKEILSKDIEHRIIALGNMSTGFLYSLYLVFVFSLLDSLIF